MQFHHTTLANGLQVIAECNPDVYSVAAGFFVKTGSRDETAALAGVSHFLEHMVFKGTERRDALRVNQDLDRIGAKHNAQTSEEETIYYVACLPEFLSQAFDVLSDILRPSLRTVDFETEKQVIIEEIQMYQDNPMMAAYEAAKELHFAPHVLGQSVLGTPESIQALQVDQMRDYFQRRYTAPNIVLALAGRVDWNEVQELAGQSCAGWPDGPAARELPPARGSRQFRAILRKDDAQQTILGVADAPPLESVDRYAASLLALILGDQTCSRLYWELIDPGHADGAELSYQDFNNAGCYFTFLSCDPAHAQENVERVARVYQDVTDRGVTADELEQAKNKVLSRAVLRSERPMGRLMPLGLHWMYRGRHVTVAEEIEAINRVEIPDIQRILSQFPLDPMTLVSVGPTTDLSPS